MRSLCGPLACAIVCDVLTPLLSCTVSYHLYRATNLKQEIDEPPIKTIPEGNRVTIADLKAMYQGTPLKITDELSMFAVVTMDEQGGNV